MLRASFGLVKDESVGKIRVDVPQFQLKRRKPETKSYMHISRPANSVDFTAQPKAQSEAKVLPSVNEVQRSLPCVKKKPIESTNTHHADKVKTKGTSFFVKFMEDTLLPKLKQEDSKVLKRKSCNYNPLEEREHSKSPLKRISPFVKNMHQATVIYYQTVAIISSCNACGATDEVVFSQEGK
eukprot:TRINITY_DN1206_c0_g3_i1.p1 TRINITY_DN1206_c0_g3~~TRINITY_DN1206_c0_g3_i1.p1  ORF type:complete len:182 (-),score=44.31 TRINITY_DN1206_c0_g3_i1:245-790(-)